MSATATLPTFDWCVGEIAAAERGDGWLASCVEADRYLLLASEFVGAVAARLSAISTGSRVEVCAGRGKLAAALARYGIEVIAIDVDPPAGCGVLRVSAEDALQRWHPRVVLGCFVPSDARVDEVVLACPSVRHYLVLGARVGGELGSARLWRAPGWTRRPLAEISRWMLTRHDVWTGQAGCPIVQHGEAWCFSRSDNAGSVDMVGMRSG